jgi:drug/metabolite transporter (DMT)-like permease
MTPMRTLLVSISLAVVGQILMKLGVNHIGSLTLDRGTIVSTVARVFSSPAILVGLAFYGASAFLWLIGISRVALSVAYPLVAITYVAVPVLSCLFFGEQLTLMKLSAMAIIVIGVLLLSRG